MLRHRKTGIKTAVQCNKNAYPERRVTINKINIKYNNKR